MATSLDPDTFWDEARRYGVTVVTYTWTQLRDLVEAPPHPGEQDHPIRLFVGSGMPRGLWRRVIDRFAPAAVVEFWTTSEGDAILANVNGGKPGSLGRTLPGSAEVRIARADLKTGKLETDSRGYAVACDVDEPGILLTRTSPTAGTAGPVLRNLFAKGDAWLSTGAIVARDVDGDHWLRGTVRTMIHTGTGAVAPQPIADALGSVTAVDLVAVYGAPTVAGDELAVAAVTLRAGRALTPEEVQHALAPLEATQQPAVVRVVEQIPTTRWHRPLPDALRQQAIATSTATRPAFVRDAATGQYRRLTASRHRRLGPAHASPPNPAPAGARPTTPSRC
jgi:putative long chain acyl-CoA synthase